MIEAKPTSQRTITICTVALGFVWLYMGLVPKLVFPETGELEMTRGSGLFRGYEEEVVFAVGVGEMIFGLIIMFVKKKIVHILSIVGLCSLALGALAGKPEVYTHPFSPIVITVPMITLSWIVMRELKN